MFSTPTLLAFFFAPILAQTTIPASQCLTPPVQCCTDTGKASDSAFNAVLKVFGIDLPANTSVAMGCSPISNIAPGMLLPGTFCFFPKKD
ncbi:hypothetical protein DL96DRAFT_105492 [Flagelloscypha sp. PMI_526]|nr:hypothetical protein DL96DRAFT_105492 [Flagelloscypha sp. PMI_526]